MKSLIQLISIAIFIGIISMQPAFARLIATYDQALITIEQIEDEGNIVAEDGTIFAVHSPELIQKAKAFKKQQVRILYVVMGEKNTITKIKPAATPPFEVPARAISGEATRTSK